MSDDSHISYNQIYAYYYWQRRGSPLWDDWTDWFAAERDRAEPQASPLENTPVRLKPIYSTPNPNTIIQLYNGRLEVTQSGSTFTGKGVVQLEWLL